MSTHGSRRLVGGAALLVVAMLGLVAPGAPASYGALATGRARAVTDTTARPGHVPVLAYYYIWMDASYWNSGKSDLPELGKYSSDDTRVMRQQVQWAKQAGIDGFIVSWKNTTALDRRLSNLVDIAQQENFKLGLIYEGLDYSRKPLPGGAATVAKDLDYFTTNYASRPPFQIFDKPLVIWSGTWEYSPDDVSSVTAARRSNLLILASERNVKGYERLANYVDGNAYYWSSVNPTTYKGYLDKLVQMGRAANTHGGLWIAPAAPGFDARKIGGSSVVSRDGGQTFDKEISTALMSKPDALGLISWNEFSENSHIEPSQNYGFQYLNLVGERLGNGPPIPDPRTIAGNASGAPAAGSGSSLSDAADSSSSGSKGFPVGVLVFPAFVLFFVLVLIAAARRGQRPGRWGQGPRGGNGGGGGWPPDGSRPPAPPGSRRARREARKRSRFRLPGRTGNLPRTVPGSGPGPGAPAPARKPQPSRAEGAGAAVTTDAATAGLAAADER